jgi:BMFP domain-containing protein YqiC
MRDTKSFEAISAAVRSIMPPGLAADAEKNLRAALQAAFERLDLVSREELEVQEVVLARTRERLERLEQLVAELEQRLLKK